jgi:hypothetical protein
MDSTTSYPAEISIKKKIIKISRSTMIPTYFEPFGLPLDLLGKIVVISSEFEGD